MTFMNNMRAVIGFLAIVLLAACSDASGHADGANESRDPLEAFNDFPDSLFQSIYWGQPVSESRYHLMACGFNLVDSSGAFNYYNQADSTQVIVPDESKIRNLKVVLRSQDYLSSGQRLMNAFSLSASAAQQSPEFSIFE